MKTDRVMVHVACVCSVCPAKVFVNEDRMAARLHDLHLDNNNLDWHPDLEREPWYCRRARYLITMCLSCVSVAVLCCLLCMTTVCLVGLQRI